MGLTKRLIAVDPGGTTGVAIYEWFGPREGITDGRFIVTDGEPLEMVGFIEDFLKMYECHVIAERFIVTSVKHSVQYEGLEVIGALRYLTHRHGSKFELQSRADRKRAPQGEVEALAKINIEPSQHMRDAAAHLLVAAARLDVRIYQSMVEDLRRS